MFASDNYPRYWPADTDYIDVAGLNVVSRETQFVNHRDAVLKRTFSVGNVLTGEERTIVQIHLTNWSTDSSPSSLTDFLTFFVAYRETFRSHSNSGPVLVHGLSGLQRTGATLLFDICVHSALDTGIVNLPKVLLSLRNQRAGLLSSIENYIFVYEALLELLVNMRTPSILGAMDGKYFRTIVERWQTEIHNGVVTAKKKKKKKKQKEKELPRDVDPDDLDALPDPKSESDKLEDSEKPPVPPRTTTEEEGVVDISQAEAVIAMDEPASGM